MLRQASSDGVEAALIAAGIEFIEDRGVVLAEKEEE